MARHSTELVVLLRRPGPPVVLILDDLQELSAPRVWGELETLLSQAGDRLRLVIACRTDPALTLYRFRIRGALAELRNGTLGFTLDETAQMLNAHGVRLTESALVELHAVMRAGRRDCDSPRSRCRGTRSPTAWCRGSRCRTGRWGSTWSARFSTPCRRTSARSSCAPRCSTRSARSWWRR